MPDSYDAPWKIAIARYFREFMAFYFPAAHNLIDWEQPCDFLDTELEQLAPNAAAGSRRADDLIRLCKPDGQSKYTLLHIEVQRRYCSNFCRARSSYKLAIRKIRRATTARKSLCAAKGYAYKNSAHAPPARRMVCRQMALDNSAV